MRSTCLRRIDCTAALPRLVVSSIPIERRAAARRLVQAPADSTGQTGAAPMMTRPHVDTAVTEMSMLSPALVVLADRSEAQVVCAAGASDRRT
jgi:hypothetical protein